MVQIECEHVLMTTPHNKLIFAWWNYTCGDKHQGLYSKLPKLYIPVEPGKDNKRNEPEVSRPFIRLVRKNFSFIKGSSTFPEKLCLTLRYQSRMLALNLYPYLSSHLHELGHLLLIYTLMMESI